jgi:hypothetical protein
MKKRTLMVQWLACSPLMQVDCGFKARSGQTKDYNIGNCCFFAKYSALTSKSKDWLDQNRIMCSSGPTCLPADCCFSELTLYKSNKVDIITSHRNIISSRPDIAEKLIP